MMLSAHYLISPATVRIALPIALAVGYILYHWWRWCMMHPKINIDELPEPAPEVIKVAQKEPPAPVEAKVAEEKAEEPKIAEEKRSLVPETPDKPVEEQPRQHRESFWMERRNAEMIEAKFAVESCDPYRLKSLYRRACAHRPEFFVRLGEYAWYRGALVEAHFWFSLARTYGVMGLDELIVEVRSRWMRARRPAEADNLYDQFPPERNVLALALIRRDSGVDKQDNEGFIAFVAQNGNDDAKRILDYENSSGCRMAREAGLIVKSGTESASGTKEFR